MSWQNTTDNNEFDNLWLKVTDYRSVLAQGGGGSRILQVFLPFLDFFRKNLEHPGRGAPPTAPPEYATEMLTIEFKIFINIY